MAFTFECPSTVSGLRVLMHINEHGVSVTPQQRGRGQDPTQEPPCGQRDTTENITFITPLAAVGCRNASWQLVKA